MSIIQSDQPPSRRMLIGAVVGATIGILLPEALRMIARREGGSVSQLTSKELSEVVPPAATTSQPMPASPVATSSQRGSPSLRPAKEISPSVTLTASPKIIRAGETSRLTWSSANASGILIMPSIGFVEPSGSMEVSPNQSTPFVIAAVTKYGLVETDDALVEVLSEMGRKEPVQSDAGEAMVTGSITASPETRIANKPSLLRWNSFDATSVAILPTIGLVGGAGEIEVYPNETTAFSLLLWNATGSFGRASAIVRVYRWPENETK